MHPLKRRGGPGRIVRLGNSCPGSKRSLRDLSQCPQPHFPMTSIPMPKSLLVASLSLGALVCQAGQAPKKEETFDPNKPISYYKQIRPILQGTCQGCHQPAKAKGKYMMTEFAKM